MMHDDEVATDDEQVRRLVADQFPEWAGLPLTRLPPSGTDHTLDRFGDDLLARMPRIDGPLDQADTDSRWLPVLAPRLPLPVPCGCLARTRPRTTTTERRSSTSAASASATRRPTWVGALPYYWDRSPAIADHARRTIAAVPGDRA